MHGQRQHRQYMIVSVIILLYRTAILRIPSNKSVDTCIYPSTRELRFVWMSATFGLRCGACKGPPSHAMIVPKRAGDQRDPKPVTENRGGACQFGTDDNGSSIGIHRLAYRAPHPLYEQRHAPLKELHRHVHTVAIGCYRYAYPIAD